MYTQICSKCNCSASMSYDRSKFRCGFCDVKHYDNYNYIDYTEEDYEEAERILYELLEKFQKENNSKR